MEIQLPTSESVKFAGNEVLLLKFDNVTDWNNAVVISTGDPDKYKVQRSIRRGIVANLTMTYFEVVHLVLEMSALGAKIQTNLLFPGGLEDCIRLGNVEFEKLADKDEKYALARQRIHEDWDSLTIKDSSGNEQEIRKSTGITGIASPTGDCYCTAS
jgi:hypothetical protein